MNKTAWIILGATFVVIFGAAAAVLALLIFGEVAPPPEPKDDPPRSTMERRLESLEDEVRELRKQLKAEREKGD